MVENNQKILIGIGILIFGIMLLSIITYLIGTKDGSNLSEGVKIVGMTSGIGSAGNNTGIDEQIYSYDISLFNGGNDEVYINWVEPIYSNELLNKSLTENHEVIVEKIVPPNTYIEISGELKFDSKGLSKTEIESWDPYITDFRISYEKIIPSLERETNERDRLD